MSIQQMTQVSYLLTILAIISAIVSVILFLTFDIPRCIRMVRIKYNGMNTDKMISGQEIVDEEIVYEEVTSQEIQTTEKISTSIIMPLETQLIKNMPDK